MQSIILYTKEVCPLCDELKEKLNELQEQYPHQLTEVDITQNEEHWFTYRFKIPVLQIGKKKLFPPISFEQLSDFLKIGS